MELDTYKLVAAGALAGFLGFGGVSLAGAQETTTTTEDSTTTAPDDTTDDSTADDPSADEPTEDDATPTDGKEGCDEDEGAVEGGVEGSSL